MLMGTERKQIVEYGKRLVTEHLTQGTGGNISILDPETGYIAISPSGIDYFAMKLSDVVIMKMDGTIVEGQRNPSSEKDLHIALYEKKPNIRAIVHTHSMYCTVLGLVDLPIKAVHYAIAEAGVTHLPIAPYVTFGTRELADAVAQSIGDSNACMMKNHGMIACGDSIANAFSLAANSEWVAELQWRAMCIGQPTVLTDEQMSDVIHRFQSYGQADGKKGY